MSTTIEHDGKLVEIDTIHEIFKAEEGSIDQLYGRIGNGKTYNATADIIERLKYGSIEYANWPISLKEFTFDQSKSFKYTLYGILGIKKRFYNFLPSNLHYFEISDEWAQKEGYKSFEDWLASRTDCVLNIDEGHIIFDSYMGTKMSMSKRASILHTRHFNRRLIIVSQRPTAIHVSARANVNRFYKCEKIFGKFGILIFRKSEYQDMIATGETVDDEAKPISTKWYFANKKILNAYDTRYLRRGAKSSQLLEVESYDYSYRDRWIAFLHTIPGLKWVAELKLRPPQKLSTSKIAKRYNWSILKKHPRDANI